jgi:hypothetical protein
MIAGAIVALGKVGVAFFHESMRGYEPLEKKITERRLLA